MLHRLTLLALAAFWLTMSYLLWRSEFRGKGQLGSEVPVEVVWEKILTAPDNSNLEVRQGRKRLGYVRWSANIGEEVATGKVASEEFRPDGMIKKLAEYTLDMDGSILFGEAGRYRFYAGGRFGPKFHWKQLILRVHKRPLLWEVQGSAELQEVKLLAADGENRWEQTVTFEQMRDPERLMRQLGGPAMGVLYSNLLGRQPGLAPLAGPGQRPALKWTAHNDWLQIGYTRARVYRLHGSLAENLEATIYVSRVGEILRVELPWQIVLINDEIR
ncbi:MAG: hypothetical protein AB1705_12070 [Verrucomicrobiota bacterium]